jgi:excisionase family DNA binding protein
MSKSAGVLKLFEVEKQLGVSRWTLYVWLKRGKIHGIKLPCGHYRIPTREIEALKVVSSTHD